MLVLWACYVMCVGAVYSLNMLAQMVLANHCNCQRLCVLGHDVLGVLDNAGEGQLAWLQPSVSSAVLLVVCKCWCCLLHKQSDLACSGSDTPEW